MNGYASMFMVKTLICIICFDVTLSTLFEMYANTFTVCGEQKSDKNQVVPVSVSERSRRFFLCSDVVAVGVFEFCFLRFPYI